MNCIECDAPMVAGPIVVKDHYRGLDLSVEMDHGWKCNACGFTTFAGQHSVEFGNRLRKKYREAVGLMEADQVRAIRAASGLSQAEFAKMTTIPIATLKRMEKRGVASRGLNQLAREVFVQFDLGGPFIELPSLTQATEVCWLGASKAFEDCRTVARTAVAESRDEAPERVWKALGEHVWAVGAKCSTLAYQNVLAERLHHGQAATPRNSEEVKREKRSEACLVA